MDPFGVESTTRSQSEPAYHSEVELEIGQPVSGNAAMVLSGAPEIDSHTEPDEPAPGAASAPSSKVQSLDGTRDKGKTPTLAELVDKRSRVLPR